MSDLKDAHVTTQYSMLTVAQHLWRNCACPTTACGQVVLSLSPPDYCWHKRMYSQWPKYPVETTPRGQSVFRRLSEQLPGPNLEEVRRRPCKHSEGWLTTGTGPCRPQHWMQPNLQAKGKRRFPTPASLRLFSISHTLCAFMCSKR